MTDRTLRIGITCFPTYGGSGVIATEIGMEMARRGHLVHFITYDIPHRLDRFQENIFFHEVEVSEYPLFVHPNYAIALASKMVEVAEREKLDILHVHYAIPHAASAYLAKQILGKDAPPLITTLHGTDITLVGNQRSYLPITRFSITESDAVTVPSKYLKEATFEKLAVSTDTAIEIIPNFVDTNRFSPPANRSQKMLPRSLGLCKKAEKLITHVSNFRPVKRLQDVVLAFAEVQKEVPCHLLLIGDGPERSATSDLVRELGIKDAVCFLGRQETFTEILQSSDIFLLPSATESFGLAALEAMSCGVPVVATNTGGIPEVVVDGETGFLAPLGDTSTMAQAMKRLLTDSALHQRTSAAARERAVSQFSEERIIPMYEKLYYRLAMR